MPLDQQRIAAIVSEVLERLEAAPGARGGSGAPRGACTPTSTTRWRRRGRRSAPTTRPRSRRGGASSPRCARRWPASTRRWPRLAVEETGLGRFEDKIAKNRLVTERTPGPEDLEPVTWTGDHGLTLMERAPYGVIAASRR